MPPKILVKIWGDLPMRHLGDVASLLGVDGQHLTQSAARHEPAVAMLEPDAVALRGRRLAESLELYRVGFRVSEPLSPWHDISVVYARRAIPETEELLIARHVEVFVKDSGNDEPDDGPLVPAYLLSHIVDELESGLASREDDLEGFIRDRVRQWAYNLKLAQLPEEGALRLRD